MGIPTNLCHKCQSFMKVEKINGEYVMSCPECKEEEKED
jgi:DNA-directed RNA polymerase subunit M/transcription elongation factor TFIIS